MKCHNYFRLIFVFGLGNVLNFINDCFLLHEYCVLMFLYLFSTPLRSLVRWRMRKEKHFHLRERVKMARDTSRSSFKYKMSFFQQEKQISRHIVYQLYMRSTAQLISHHIISYHSIQPDKCKKKMVFVAKVTVFVCLILLLMVTLPSDFISYIFS